MPRRRPTSRTFSTRIRNIRCSSAALLLAATVFCAIPARAQTASLESILSQREAALAQLHLQSPKTLEIRGLLAGAGLAGSFHTWQSGGNARTDETFGIRVETTLRTGGKTYAVNENGDVRELRGLLLERGRTDEFIESGAFAAQPRYDRFVGQTTLEDGRRVYEIAVAPPNGQPETLDLDSTTLMIDRISYDDEDGVSTRDFYDYARFAGVLVAQREVDSNGDRQYDVTRFAQQIDVDRPIAARVFAIPPSTVVQTDRPVTVPLIEHFGHYYVTVRLGKRDYRFLLDTGAQAVVLGTRVAAQLGLQAEGHLEVAGAQRTGGLGIAPLDSLQIGGVTLPLRMVTVLDLSGATGVFDADGVLGYPFFASADVRIDPVAKTMTFAKPGALGADGEAIPLDVDRELLEMHAAVNGTNGRFVVDTGNSTELLLFEPFMRAHPFLLQFQQRRFSSDYGVGGAISAQSATIDELDFGKYRLFNRYANLIATNRGAFADRFDAGNIGMGVLKNFVVTFAAANAKMYVRRSADFDDGRYRPRIDQ